MGGDIVAWERLKWTLTVTSMTGEASAFLGIGDIRNQEVRKMREIMEQKLPRCKQGDMESHLQGVTQPGCMLAPKWQRLARA